MNMHNLRSRHAIEQDVEEADFEIISPTAKSAPSVAGIEGENKIGFAILTVALAAAAFLVSGGWHVFRS